MPEMVKIMQEIRTTYINGHEIPVLISDEKEALLAAKAAGRAIIGLWRPEQEMDAISAAKYVVEDLNDVSEEYLERIARRHLGLPWRICETERLLIRELFADDFIPTAAAGIAFVKTKFPFSVAYDIAEQCCKNAKKQTLLREGTAKSSVDFQMVYSGVSGSLSAMRKEYYMVDGNCLIQRPYVFDESSPHAFKAFESLAQKLRKADKNGSVAVSKLKGLRNAYGISEKSAENYGQYILAHANGAAERQLAEELAHPFENGKAIFFDCLDVWDVAWEEVE